MPKPMIKILSLTALFCLSLNSFATNRALLIGISQYKNPDYRLQGPEHDINTLEKILAQYWRFNPQNIKTLVNEQATRDNILNALIQLKDITQANDQVFIYFSGHGTSEHDPDSGLTLPYSNSGALVPYGFMQDAINNQQIIDNLIIGKRDLRPLLSAMDNKNAHIFIAFDNCYSKNTNRGLLSSLPSRTPANLFKYPKLNNPQLTNNRNDRQKVEPYPYSNIVYFSAASAKEPAKDIPTSDLEQFPTIDNKPHGAFTDALLRGLSGQFNADKNRDGQTSYSELLAAIKDFMKTRGYPHEPYISPALADDHGAISLRSVMNRSGTLAKTPTPKTTAALLSVYSNASDPELLHKLRQRPHLQISKQYAELNLEKSGYNYLLRNQAGDLITTLYSPSIEEVVGRIQQEAWKKHFKQELQSRASINIEMSVKDGITGSTVMIGDKLAFSLRSETDIYLLLLDANSKGTLTTLYPFRANELEPIPAYYVKYIPSENNNDWIKVQAPVGIDHVMAIGFAEQPDFLQEFVGKKVLLLGSDLYKKLMQHLKSARFGYSEIDLLTVAKD